MSLALNSTSPQFSQALFLLPLLVLTGGSTSARSEELTPSGEDLPYAATIRETVRTGIEQGQLPGAVVVVAGPERIEYAQAFGDRSLDPEREDMTLDTVFDLASLTKPIATATSVMKLAEEGKVDLDAQVSKYLPEFTGQGKEHITVADLLLHVGGLIPDNALADYEHGSAEAWERICELKLRSEPKSKFSYTDVGFIVLGKLVRRLSGKTLHEYSAEAIFTPLAMSDTGYLPGKKLRERAAPTEKRDGQWMRGEVHDPRAYRLDGIAGHAGLFSSAGDLVKYGQMMLGKGQRGTKHVLRPETVATMTQPRTVPRGTRTYGWDHRTAYSRNRGEALSDSAFGHGGFTGTVLWIDPEKQLVFVFLSNRLHPDGKGSVNGLAGKIATAVATERPSADR